LARKALAHNASVASVPTGGLDVSDPDAIATQINDLAAQVQEEAKEEAGPVGGFLVSYKKETKALKDYDYDAAFPVLVRNLVKEMWWVSWFVLAALCGAVISSLASMLNSASTIATMDLFAKFTHTTDQALLVKVGRGFVVLFVLLAAFVAPKLDNFESIFKYIQEFQGFISPGILAVFIFGFFSPRTPRWFGVVGIATNIICYGGLKLWVGDWLTSNGLWYSPEMAFLDRMAVCFFIVLLTGAIITLVKPMRTPVVMPVNEKMAMETSRGAKMAGIGVVIATIALYAVFW